VDNPSDQAVIKMVNEAMHTYKYAPVSEPKLTSPSEVQQAVKGFKFGKALKLNSIWNRVLRHLPKHMITILTGMLTAVLHRQ
jgi:hypothetical protein